MLSITCTRNPNSYWHSKGNMLVLLTEKSWSSLGFKRGSREQPCLQGLVYFHLCSSPLVTGFPLRLTFYIGTKYLLAVLAFIFVWAKIVRFILVNWLWSHAYLYTCHCGQGDSWIAWLRARSRVGGVSFPETTPNRSPHGSPNKSGPVGRRKGVTDAGEVTKTLLQLERTLGYEAGDLDSQIIFCFTKPNVGD